MAKNMLPGTYLNIIDHLQHMYYLKMAQNHDFFGNIHIFGSEARNFMAKNDQNWPKMAKKGHFLALKWKNIEKGTKGHAET